MIRQAFRSIFWDHLHNADDARAGGKYFDILAANLSEAFHRGGYVDVGEWNKTGTGTLTRSGGVDEDYLQFVTPATSALGVDGNLSGMVFSFGSIIDLQMRLEVLQNTDIFLRAGINTDRILDVQDTARRQFGLEACPASGTNFVIISANGNAANLLQVSTTIPINNASSRHQLTYHPGIDVKYYHETVLNATTNSANTPSNGSTQRARQLVAGVKTNINSTRTMRMHWYHILADPQGELTTAKET